MLLKWALLILALAGSPAAAQEIGRTLFSIDQLRDWCLRTMSDPPAKGQHLSRLQCGREVESAERVIREREKASGNVPVNMGACLFYCEAQFPGMVTSR